MCGICWGRGVNINTVLSCLLLWETLWAQMSFFWHLKQVASLARHLFLLWLPFPHLLQVLWSDVFPLWLLRGFPEGFWDLADLKLPNWSSVGMCRTVCWERTASCCRITVIAFAKDSSESILSLSERELSTMPMIKRSQMSSSLRFPYLQFSDKSNKAAINCSAVPPSFFLMSIYQGRQHQPECFF